MNDQPATREQRFDPSTIKDLLESSRYNGRLRPHMKVILFMWSQGFSLSDIGKHLHCVLGVPLSMYDDRGGWDYINGKALTGLVRVVLRSCGLNTAPLSKSVALNGILPVGIARAQEVWDRDNSLIRMRELGFTYRQIGERLRVPYQRVQAQVESALHKRKTLTRSPIERHLDKAETRIDNLAGCGPMGQRIIEHMAKLSSSRDWLYV